MDLKSKNPQEDKKSNQRKKPGRIFQPFPLGERFIVLPPQTARDIPEGKLPLVLGPGKAFGSGEHETTASCIEFLEQIPFLSRKKVLDFGCGTGILAIAAALLGASRIVALDNDPEALAACKNNLLLNGVENRVFCREGTLEQVGEKDFDLILANIYDDIILKNSSPLAALTARGGYLLLSGITYEGHSEVKSRFLSLGFTALKDRMMEDYCTILLSMGSPEFPQNTITS